MRQIESKLTRDKVAAELRRAILYGSFQANEELSQEKIARDLGVSIMPVREAIQMLSMEGLVTVRPNRAPIVSEISDSFIKDHFEIRSLLEKEAVARACIRSGDCSELRECYQNGEAAIKEGDYQSFNYYNGRIHQLIWKLSGNQKLEKLLSQMWHTMFLDNYAKEYAALSNKEHGMLIDCIVNREPEVAKKIMEAHVTRSYERILKLNAQRKNQNNI